jgi:hypothetical protein
MAQALYRQDPEASYRLLLDLEKANSKLPDARQLRQKLFAKNEETFQ